MAYDLKKEIDARAKNAKTSGTALQGEWTLLSDCERLTTAAGSRGVWAIDGVSTITADATYYKQGAKSVKCALAATSINTGVKFTATTPFNLEAYNYIGMWFYVNGGTLGAGNITLSLNNSQGDEVLASTDFPAIQLADYWVYVPISLAACTEKKDIAVIHIICEDEIGTYNFYVDNLEAFEFRAGLGPLREAVVKKVRVGTVGFAIGDAVAYEPVGGGYVIGLANGIVNAGFAISAGTANTTMEGTEEAWVLVEGPVILKANEALTAGDGMSLADGTTGAQLWDDGGTDTPMEYTCTALEDCGAQYACLNAHCKGLIRRGTTG